MKYSTEITDGIVVFRLSEKIMGGMETSEFLEDIRASIEKGHKNFIIDIAGIDWMNSTGTAVLISAYTSIRNGGGDLVMIGITDKIESLFTITKLISVFKFSNSFEEAKKYFQQ